MKKLTILLLFLLLAFPIIATDDEVGNILGLQFTIFRESDDFIVDKMFVLQGYRGPKALHEEDSYKIELYHEREDTIYVASFDSDFIQYTDPPKIVDEMPMSLYLPYDEDVESFSVFRDGEEIFSYEMGDKLCNLDEECNNFENALSCEEDCSIDQDGFCTSDEDDGICDPDCTYDSDCPGAADISETEYDTEKPFPWQVVIIIIVALLIMAAIAFVALRED